MLKMLAALLTVAGLSLFQCSTCATPHVEVSALHDLYSSTGGNTSWLWKNETEYGSVWNFSMSSDGSYTYNPCVGWQGVKCINMYDDPCNQTDEFCNIANVNLFEYNLAGSVPSSLGFALTRLQELTLWRNSLTSSIPSSLGLLTDLVILDFDETG